MSKQRTEGPIPPTDAEVAASKAALEPQQTANNGGNGPKKRKSMTDPVLLAVARLDKLLATLPAEHAYWAFKYLSIKYGKEPEKAP